jgi:hypothetical protein
MNKNLLSNIVEKINKEGLNYSVFLHVYTVPINDHHDSDAYIRSAFGNDALAEVIQEIAGEQVIAEVESAISYVGFAGSGPSKLTLLSLEFAALRRELLVEIQNIINESQLIEKFTLVVGHPAYPVFWEFGFLFVLPNKVVIFIGASSD